jgi:hypothetical protein
MAQIFTSANVPHAKMGSPVSSSEGMSSAAELPNLDEILSSSPSSLGERSTAQILDQIIESRSSVQQRIADWNRVATTSESKGVSSGHAHFRLGILHLVNDADEAEGISHLERAYEQDQRYALGREPQRLAAYRVLSLVKDFLAHLRSRKDWQALQLDLNHRGVLISTLLALYDTTARRHILDMPVWTYGPFFAIFKNDRLRAFAGENYFCAQSMLEWVGTDGGHAFLLANEYAFARSIIGLYGGVLEAILAEKLSTNEQKPLGGLIREAYEQGHLVVGTRLCALTTMLHYFRNHIHPNKEITRNGYFIDLNVAKGLKSAIDLAIEDLLPSASYTPTGTATR